MELKQAWPRFILEIYNQHLSKTIVFIVTAFKNKFLIVFWRRYRSEEISPWAWFISGYIKIGGKILLITIFCIGILIFWIFRRPCQNLEHYDNHFYDKYFPFVPPKLALLGVVRGFHDFFCLLCLKHYIFGDIAAHKKNVQS